MLRGSPTRAPAELVSRYAELEGAFELDLAEFGHRGPYRLAAACLLRFPDELAPTELAARTLATSGAIARHPAWLGAQGPALRLVLAAILVAHDRSATAFVDELGGLHDAMESARVHYSPVHRTLAVLALRLGVSELRASDPYRESRERELSEADVVALQAVYAAIRSHHFWLTNERLVPICGYLAPLGQEPAALGRKTTSIYSALRKRPKLRRGRPLLAAAATLASSELEPDAVSERVTELDAKLPSIGVEIGVREYGKLAALALLALPV
jgi:hypothetical protein